MPALTISGFNLPGTVVVIDIPAEMREVTQQAAQMALKEAQEYARQFRDTGALVSSIQATEEDMTAVVSSNVAYAAAVESGRPAGARQPPVEAIATWASRHGIDEANAYVIARAIGRRGITGRLFMKRAYDVVQAQLPGIVSQVAAKRGVA